MAITARAVGAWAYAASGSVTPTLPTHAVGDMLMVRVAYKSSAIATCAASVSTAGWNKLGEFHDGTTNSGNGTGSVAVAHFWKIATKSSETNPTVAFSQAVTQVGHSAVSFQKASTEVWIDPVGDGGGFATGAPISATIQSHVSVTSGDVVVFFLASRDDTAFTSPTITQTGVTFDTVTEYPATAGLDGSGADGSYDAGYRTATAGTSSAAAVITATIATETGSAWMTRLRVYTPGTKLYLRLASSDYGTGNNDTNLRGSTLQWASHQLSTTAGSSNTSRVTSTIAGPIAGQEVGGFDATTVVGAVWYSLPLDADVTISGGIAWNVWYEESNAAANVAINGVLDVIDGATGTITEIDRTAQTYEVDVTTETLRVFVETPGAGVACKRGDRLRVRLFNDDASGGSMAVGHNAILWFDGPTAEASGDTWVALTESVSFVSEPAGTTIYPTDTASAVSTASVDREAWTSRGAGVQTDVTNTATGFTSPIQVTDTAGGTVVDWFTKPLTAFTLGGAVRVNARALETTVAANASIRCEIARVAGDGTSATTWGGTTYALEITGSEAAYSFLVSGDDLAISDGQRLRVRFFVDDAGATPAIGGGGALVTGHTVTLYYAGTSGGASGDTYLTFTQTLTEFSAGTNAAAQLASGTGASNTASGNVQPNTGLASGTGGAPNAVVVTGIATNAQAATGTGSALAATILLAVSAALASGTGSAHQASVTVAPTAGHATGSGTAYNATVSAAAATNAAAELAAGTGSAHDATVLTAKTVSAELAAGTGSAYAAVPAVAGAPNIGTGTGDAGAPAPAIAVNALLAEGTGTAYDATAETAAAGLTYVASTSTGGNNPTGGTWTLPGSAASGDLAIFWLYSRAGLFAINDPSGVGITTEHDTNNSTNGRLYVGYRWVVGGDTTFAWTRSAGSSNSDTTWGVDVFRGAIGSGNPFSATTGATPVTATGADPDPGAVTPADAGSAIWAIGGKRATAGATFTAPTDYTLGGTREETAGSDASTATIYRLNVTATSQDPGAIDLGATSGDNLAWTAAIKPAAAPGDTDAEVATGTGSANNAVGTIATNAGLAAGTGAANNATVTTVGITNAAAQLASGTGTANNAAPSVGAKPGLASGTGTAHNPAPAVGANAGQGTGSGTAGAIDAATAGAPNVATGTGNASGPSVAIAVNVALASGSGTAYNATASAASTTDAAAGLASGTGVANGSNPAVAPNTGTGSGTGVAGDLDIAIAVNALLASGTGTANGATVSTTSATQASADVAAGTGAANAASCNIAPTAGTATGSGTAHNVTTTASKLADAGAATGTGLARNASILAASAPNIATGTGTANGVDAAIATTGGLAAGTGQARQPAAALSGSSGSASGSGAAGAPAPAIGSRPGFASGTGAAHDPTVAVTGAVDVNAGVATGSGTAWPAFALGYTPPSEFDWTSKPVEYLGQKTYALADVARGYGRAYNAYIRWDDDELAMILLLGDIYSG